MRVYVNNRSSFCFALCSPGETSRVKSVDRAQEVQNKQTPYIHNLGAVLRAYRACIDHNKYQSVRTANCLSTKKRVQREWVATDTVSV